MTTSGYGGKRCIFRFRPRESFFPDERYHGPTAHTSRRCTRRSSRCIVACGSLLPSTLVNFVQPGCENWQHLSPHPRHFSTNSVRIARHGTSRISRVPPLFSSGPRGGIMPTKTCLSPGSICCGTRCSNAILQPTPSCTQLVNVSLPRYLRLVRRLIHMSRVALVLTRGRYPGKEVSAFSLRLVSTSDEKSVRP